MKKYNINILDDENIIYICGISYVIMNIRTKEVKKYFTKDGGGIGAIAVKIISNRFIHKELIFL